MSERSNQPEGMVSVLLTESERKFLIENCEKNIQFARNQLLQWATLDGDALEAIKESFLMIDGMKQHFESIMKRLESSL